MLQAERLDRILQDALDSGIPGVVATVVGRDGVLYEGAAGVRELGAAGAMAPDTIWWIASMTKAITSVAALQLVERGQLALDAPAADVLPILGEVRVLEGFDAAGRSLTRAPASTPTLRQLLTHTSGFGYEFWSPVLLRYQAVTGVPSIISCADRALELPLLADPGTRWTYGIGIDWVGKMVEAASGLRLGEYLRRHVLDPLGMHDTMFRIGNTQRQRLARLHARLPDGAVSVLDLEVPQEPEFEMGGGGLYGSVRDYGRFIRMILNDGSLDGARVLTTDTLTAMTSPQVHDLPGVRLETAMPELSNDATLLPDVPLAWGLGFLINRAATDEGRSSGSLAWAGLANSYYWIDPQRGIGAVFATQILPFFDAGAVAAFARFERAVYAS